MYILLKYIEQITSLSYSTANMSDRLHALQHIHSVPLHYIWPSHMSSFISNSPSVSLCISSSAGLCHCDKIQMLEGGQFNKSWANLLDSSESLQLSSLEDIFFLMLIWNEKLPSEVEYFIATLKPFWHFHTLPAAVSNKHFTLSKDDVVVTHSM